MGEGISKTFSSIRNFWGVNIDVAEAEGKAEGTLLAMFLIAR